MCADGNKSGTVAHRLAHLPGKQKVPGSNPRDAARNEEETATDDKLEDA